MSLRLGELLGLPAAWTATEQLPALRWLLVGVVVLWALLALAGRPRLALAAGIAFETIGVGFWVLALGRPYGFGIEASFTRWVAQLSVAATSGDPSASFLVGMPAASTPWSGLVSVGIPLRYLVWLPSVLPLLGLVTAVLALYAVWEQREWRLLACCLWLLCSTSDLAALRGIGLLSQGWAEPGAVLGVVVCVVGILLLSRLRRPFGALVAAAAALAACGTLLPRDTSLTVADTLLAATLDQGPWLLLAAWGFWRRRDPAAVALTGVGAALFCLPVSALAAHAIYRLGLLLAATPPLGELLTAAGREIAARVPRVSPAARDTGIALLLLAVAPGSFLLVWQPFDLDPVAAASASPVAPGLRAVARHIREETAPDAVFVAAPELAPYVATLAGRRVLRAPTLVPHPPDQARRERVERHVVLALGAGRLYDVRYVLASPGDFQAYGLRSPWAIADQPDRRLLFQNGSYFVYEITGNQGDSHDP